MNIQWFFITFLFLLSGPLMAETAETYKKEIQTIILESQKESIISKAHRIAHLGKKIELDINKSNYPSTEIENNELSWKVEVSTGIQLMQLSQFSKTECEKVKIRLISQMNPPSIEKIETDQNSNDRHKMIRDILEYLCYE